MSNLQEIFNRIEKSKKEQKDIKAIYKDALQNSNAYCKVEEELKELKDKKKKIEDGIKDECRVELDKLETLKADIENDSMLLSDAALSIYIKGEPVAVLDEHERKCYPSFKVKFKKD